MKKIVIIGALGYLGTELCRIYSGESWKNKIVAIDNRFLSERVSQLNKWNIEFFQGHILDNNFCTVCFAFHGCPSLDTWAYGLHSARYDRK